MQSRLRWLILTVILFLSLSLSSIAYAKAEDFFRLSGGGLLISGINMQYAEVMEMIHKEKSWQRIKRNHYVLDASVGGKFDVLLTFNNGKLTGIKTKQVGRADYY